MRTLGLLATGLFTVGACAAAAYSIMSDRFAVLEDAETRIRSTAQLILSHGEAAIEDANKIVASAQARVAEWDLKDYVKGREISNEMSRLLIGSPQIYAAWVMNAEGRNVADTISDPPAPVSAIGRKYFSAHQRGEPEPVIVAEASVGAVSGQPRFTLSRSVRESDGSLKAVVATAIHSRYFDELYRATVPWEEGRAGLYKGADELARKADQSRASPEFILAVEHEMAKSASGTTILPEGSGARIISWVRSERLPGVYATASQPLHLVLERWRTRSMIAAIGVVAFGALVWATMLASAAKAKSLANEIAVREVHHRVRNSLQLALSVVSLRARSNQGNQALDEVRAQIEAIAEAHKLLQISESLEKVDIGALLAELCKHTPHPDHIDRRCSCPTIYVAGDGAPNLALILNEVITNALKHAHSKVAVSGKLEEGTGAILIEDDGPGMPDGFSFDKGKGFGLRTIRLMARSIDAEISVRSRDGGGSVFSVSVATFKGSNNV